MKTLRNIFLTATMLLTTLAVNAQSKMEVTMKDGSVLSLYVSEINKMTWTDDSQSGGDNDPDEQTVTGDATNVTSYSATVTCYANNILDNLATDLKIGVIYTDNGTPSKSNGTQITVSKSSVGTDGKYTVNLKDLKENTTYYYRSFVYQSGVYFLGTVKSFTTLSQNAGVTFTTGASSSITCFSAKVAATMNIDASSDYSKLAYGIAYGTTAEPTTLQAVTSRDASGAYTTTLRALAGNTVYYYRPYATIDGTTFYGNVSSFKTLEDNVVTTGDADAAGNVKSKLTIGGGAYSTLELGVCYSTTNQTPTVSDATVTKNEVDDDNYYEVNVVKSFGTTYYRSYVKIDGTAHYGAVKQVTLSMPTIATTGSVDLGLSVKWATCNIGASTPGEYGDYYAWGETTTNSDYSWSTYTLCNGSYDTMTKYCTSSSYGTVDNKTVLDPEDDVAHVKLGGNWRMPTDAELTELRTKCTWVWTQYGGHNGYVVIGSTGNAIFLPAAGFRLGTDLSSAGSDGIYWSSSLDASYSDSAWVVYFYSSDVRRSSSRRCNGRSVRPVCQ